ncbi:MAG TPA: acyl-CoA dehydrogenase family protein [Actinomycetota bacterium]|nr:acyl-CoA dehydrogenase family protein [Actinomycetota bacterium]
MDLDLTQEQRDLQRTVRGFAEEVVAPVAAEHDRDETFPLDVVRKMGELGLFGLLFPSAYGGLDGDLGTFCLCLEELARVDASVAITLEAAVGLGANPIFRHGTEQQKQEWLVPMCRGEILGAYGLTEPGGGSDARAIQTTARLEDGSWVLNGSKSFITNSGTPLSKVCTVAARTGGDEISAFLVPTDAPGFELGPPYRKIGWHASDTHEISLRDCRVPEANLLGERGRGYAELLEVLDEGRVAIAAVSVGLARGCLEESVAYAREREAFGRPIGGFEAIAFKLADMRVKVDAARLLVLRAAWLRDLGRPFKTEAAIAKLHASETAVECAREAVQVHGGYGYIEEFPVARYYRDAKILEIGEGTSEIQRILIARDLGLPETELT